MEKIGAELKQLLLGQGAALVGFGDISELVKDKDSDMKYGVSVVVSMTPSIVKNIENGPTEEYYLEYKRLNSLLDHLVIKGATFLQNKGFKALAQTTSSVKEFGNNRTLLPHKSFATRAGIGWIGKCALLVTEEYGSAIRISSILTNAPLKISDPINCAKCNSCMVCVNACPADAASGDQWNVTKDRDEFFNPVLCRTQARLRAAKIGIESTICGKCIQVCPYTQRYINK
ncbi:4Fe-4S double cluster binding domain-containing protein [Candidatus Clostridium stratigraminis]|uniref:4Fe-4S double cluster binding domain-containing protein n=1 Tax=Candidatus Clostridium stratigraminis TaxID=3381661 RepID=A0ABW8T6T4_9CLOT